MYGRHFETMYVSFSIIFFFILFYLLLAIQHVGSYKVPQPRIEHTFLAVEAWSLNHWTSREVPGL